mmetsp:Transcript_6042/g.10558  ORF Transcript_6042/g.10558 Transcript_6042/m.10558 type:complete len:235 (-) Transcript_6042:327-1031(-)
MLFQSVSNLRTSLWKNQTGPPRCLFRPWKLLQLVWKKVWLASLKKPTKRLPFRLEFEQKWLVFWRTTLASTRTLQRHLMCRRMFGNRAMESHVLFTSNMTDHPAKFMLSKILLLKRNAWPWKSLQERHCIVPLLRMEREVLDTRRAVKPCKPVSKCLGWRKATAIPLLASADEYTTTRTMCSVLESKNLVRRISCLFSTLVAEETTLPPIATLLIAMGIAPVFLTRPELVWQQW